MSTQPQWTPMPPAAEPPAETLPPGARALLARLDAWAERDIARFPRLAEAIRRRAEQRQERADAAD